MKFPAIISACLIEVSAINGVCAEDRIFELWRGQIVIDRYDCSARGTSGIIIDEPVNVRVSNETAYITCPALIFRPGGKLLVDGPLSIDIKQLAGPLSVVALNEGATTEPEPRTRAGRGKSGNSGMAGVAAPTPPKCPFARFPVSLRQGGFGRNGLHGAPGVQGLDGRPGLAGKKGPAVTLNLDLIEPGATIDIQVVGANGGPGGTGGVGGDGGSGGNGGLGGDGANGTLAFIPGRGGHGGKGGDGGAGGDGGSGGDGGIGGTGGDIAIRFSDNSFALTSDVPLNLLSLGGQGGAGGSGGYGGDGGRGGFGGQGGSGGVASIYSSVPNGKQGIAGGRGVWGKNGSPGETGKTGAAGQFGFTTWGGKQMDLDDLIELLTQ